MLVSMNSLGLMNGALLLSREVMEYFIDIKRVERIAHLFTLSHAFDYIRVTQTNDVADYWSMTRAGYYKTIGRNI